MSSWKNGAISSDQLACPRRTTEIIGKSIDEKPKENHMSMKKKPKLGSGERFKAIVQAAAASGAKNPAAVAAAAGRKKYGAKKMAMLAAKGRKKKK